jgi:hypothetical protein
MIGEGKMNIGLEKEIFRSQPVPEKQILPEPVSGTAKDEAIHQNIENKDINVSSSNEPESVTASSDRQYSPVPGNIDAFETKNEPTTIARETNVMKTMVDLNHPQQPLPPVIPQQEEKEIEHILFFYKDKTFSLYRPS